MFTCRSRQAPCITELQRTNVYSGFQVDAQHSWLHTVVPNPQCEVQYRAETGFQPFFQANQQHLVCVYEGENIFGIQGIAKVVQTADGVYSRLKSLHLHGYKTLDPTVTAHLLQKAPNLERLALGCHSAVSSYFAGAHCPKVTTVVLSGAVTPDAIRGFSTCFPNLGTLDLKAKLMPPDLGPSLIASCTKLYRLNLDRLSGLQDKHIGLIAEQCSYLTHISLDFCNQLSIVSIVSICTHCTKLEFLSLRGNNHLPPHPLHLIAGNLHHTLKHLNIQNSCKAGRADISVLCACKLLESFDIRHMGELGSNDIAAVCTSCPHLRILRMDFEHLSDEILSAIAKQCVHIQRLYVAGPRGFANVDVRTMAARLNMTPSADGQCTTADKFRAQAIALMCARYPQLHMENCP